MHNRRLALVGVLVAVTGLVLAMSKITPANAAATRESSWPGVAPRQLMPVMQRAAALSAGGLPGWIVGAHELDNASQPASKDRAVQRASPLTVTCDWSGQQYQDFYSDPPDLGQDPLNRLGELLRVEHIESYTPEQVANMANLPSSPYGAEAYRVLYLSQSPLGTAQWVSGLMVVPTGDVPADGFPVVTWGHWTSGMGDDCAPSRRGFLDANVRGLMVWIASGYLVNSTDYVGLGTPGLHPYVVGDSEAYAMLDSTRAAKSFCDVAHGIDAPRAANQVFLAGHSQGGHAALFAQQLWPEYAPELNVLGTVAFAPGSEPLLLAQRVAQGKTLDLAPTVMAMYAQQEYYQAPITTTDWLTEPYASDLPAKIENKCIAAFTIWIGQDPVPVFQPDILAAAAEGRWDDLEPFTTYLNLNTPGSFASDVPVLIAHGAKDEIIPVEFSQQLTRRLCAFGTDTQLSIYPGARHGTIPDAAASEAIQWVADRLAGLPAPNSCQFWVYTPLVFR